MPVGATAIGINLTATKVECNRSIAVSNTLPDMRIHVAGAVALSSFGLAIAANAAAVVGAGEFESLRPGQDSIAGVGAEVRIIPVMRGFI